MTNEGQAASLVFDICGKHVLTAHTGYYRSTGAHPDVIHVISHIRPYGFSAIGTGNEAASW
jgi:hypothetical protein